MKLKTIITFFLLAFVVVSIIFMAAREIAPSSTSNPKTSPEKQDDGIIAYYFHGNKRCDNCRKIESYSREAVQTNFADQIKNGKLRWLIVNKDQPAHEHFVKDFQLYANSVVLAEVQNGKTARWKNLDKIWELLDNKTAYLEYVQTEMKSFLGDTP